MLYMLHATVPVGSAGRNAASHYLGWTTANGLQSRLKLHRAGKGACLTRAFRQAGASLLLALVVQDGSKAMERQMKANGHLSQWCPLCNPYLAVAGAPVTRAQLSLARKWSGQRSRRRKSANGGDSSATSPTNPPGMSRPEPHQASSTSCG